ncbi:DNA nucleotidylexotransferase-like isoform X1 [Haliotis rufescens]|uniref:DNA nucleotidylexotransferase-like isoform X1 n=1 Tax=Haliotis rufescens TaxID=6454 RepID=UPI00201F6676|nr:DNA nucleotidylexotransferase-like isoform X1 [Haliotis rufescens]
MSANSCEVDFSRLKLLIMPQRIQKRRLETIKIAAKKRGVQTVSELSTEVTHIVTEFETVEQVVRALKKDNVATLGDVEIVSLTWLTECFKAGKVNVATEAYRLKHETLESADNGNEPEGNTSLLPEWACQRDTPLEHHNHHLTAGIETLQLYSELRDLDQDYSRALAFRRASCVLKCLPFKVTDVSQISNIKDVGDHVKRVVKDILEDGSSAEVDQINNGEWFNKMKLFTAVFGVGPSTAKKWIERGWTSIQDAAWVEALSKDWRVRWGLAFHEELQSRVERPEADNFTAMVRAEAQSILPGTTVELTGGFRRGKKTGHDVDLLISHPREGAEVGLLPRLLKQLEKRGFILCGSHERNSFTEDVLKQDFKLSLRGQLDHFEKWLGICKFPKQFATTQKGHDDVQEVAGKTDVCSKLSGSVEEDYEPKVKLRKLGCVGECPRSVASEERDWLARRVDLIVAPHSQYYYALVGWTGSKHFNRDLRLYATRVLEMKLTSHGLYNISQGSMVPASSEKEVFDNMKIPYREPAQRNC